MDVKRLKVTELRAELGRRGLDSRGLKVELAQRLQEALDAEMLAAGPDEGGPESAGVAAGQSLARARLAGGGGGGGGENDDDDEEEDEEEDEEDEEEEDEEALLADEEEPMQAEPAAGDDGQALPQPAGEQGEGQAQAGGGGVNGAERPQEEGGGGGGGSERPSGDEAPGDAEAKQGDEQAANEDDEKAKQAGSDGERRGLKRQREEKEEHGRAYYEFREEAYNSRSKSPPPPEEEPREDDDENAVILDTYTSDLHFRATKDRYGGQPLFSEKFPNLWSGARSTHGVKKGKVCFEAKWSPAPWFTAELGDMKRAGRRLERRWRKTKSESDRACYRAHWKTYEAALTAAKKAYFSTNESTSSRPAQFVKVAKTLPLKEGCTENSLLRVGWSVDHSRTQLGEDEFSYGYDGRGLKAENGQFEEFGQPFGENDVISCFANFETEEVELSFSKNGEDLGVAFRISKESLGDRALLPHVLCKNCVVEMNFGQNEEPFFPVPEDFVFINAVPVEDRVRTPLPPKTSEECEVLLMVGLPGCGKTQWAHKHTQENLDKRYNILGTDAVLLQMRTKGPEVEELDTKSQDQLIQQAARCVSKLVQIAPRTKRNFILDQCNVYNSGQRRKLLNFKGFSRKVILIVPNEEDWKQRLELRKETEKDDVPESVMLEMKANFSLPEKCDYIDEVLYQELSKEEAQPLVTKYKEEARKLLPPSEKRTSRRNNRNKRNRQNRNRGQGYVGGQRRGYDNRVYGQQQQYWGQPGNRGGYRNFYDRYRGDYRGFYGRDDYNRYYNRDYYRDYNREWQNYYQDRDRYYRNYYGGYQGYR
ncbi:heterogeneous nuclear ribonucleoprotein U-like protein 2 isoform X2 [Eublepharis macularius]|uniref:Heterogeneous nuclear ribonucleoprotein U-like protein 2 isoform X2 n=1 Tax=Eublepharis macularius TaxID=481883 RepID=A0AA97LA60_EUBMA|nr:heterogeneous nuclear ribonucleoprotein U-like protein 2 isoform X2 [Eublepharis macularius]